MTKRDLEWQRFDRALKEQAREYGAGLLRFLGLRGTFKIARVNL